MNVNQKFDEYEDCRTPLHLAAFTGRTEVVRLLLERGADVNAKNEKGGETPLHNAAMNGHAEAAVLLLPKCQTRCSRGE